MNEGIAVSIASRAAGISASALVRALRPKQWAKNGMVFLALLFSVNQYWSPADMPQALNLVLRCAITFALFSVLASAEYLLNDLRDA
ncbi:MAG: decaprenyl-phosphate phosphoribosyltransferase, partial [Dehalococcoidia bacterium]|nr:decaprenyl-phosphate phosphoribosyltransferase [Dehalococcoidia bacterium]